MSKRISLFLFAFSLINISELNTKAKCEDITVIEASWGSSVSGSKWSEITKKAINSKGKDMVMNTPSDINKFCPNYSEIDNEERDLFWIALISKLSEFESNHNPEAKYTENFTDNNGNLIISRGLLQLSIESSNGYGCDFQNEIELHDAEKNIICGVVIMNRWVGIIDNVIAAKQDGKWKGAARYWSPFRNKNKLLKIIEYTKNINVCKTVLSD